MACPCAHRMRNEILKLQDATFPEVKRFAQRHWAAMQAVLPPSNFERLLVSQVAARFEVKWPLKRMPEPILYYARKASPEEVCATRSLGKQKAKALLILIMLAWDAVADGDTEQDFIPKEKVKPPPGPPPASDVVETLNYHWEHVNQTIAGSPLADEKLVDLGRRWGINFRTTMDRTLGEVLKYQKVQVFVEYSQKIGKKKVMPVTMIIRRACQELDPDGPFGPPPEGPASRAAELLGKLGPQPKTAAVTKLIAKISKVRADRLDTTFRRYGLGAKNAEPKTLQEIADIDGITRERVRQIQAAAESEIRDNLLCRELIRQVIVSRRGLILERLWSVYPDDVIPGERGLRVLDPLDAFCLQIHNGSLQGFFHDAVERPAASLTPLVRLRRELFASPADVDAFAEKHPGVFANPPGPYLIANPMAASLALHQTGAKDLERLAASFKAENAATTSEEEDIAPGRARAHDHEPTEADFDSLEVNAALQSYIEAKAFSILPPPYRAWTREMEHRWCVWAESKCPEDLFHSLLFVIEPDQWKQPETVRKQWAERKQRGGEYLLASPQPDYKQGVRDLDSVYGLTALALQQGGLQIGDLAMFLGWPEIFDPRAFATLAFLIGIGVLEAKRSRLGVHPVATGADGAAALFGELSFVRWKGAARDSRRIEKRLDARIAALETSDELGVQRREQPVRKRPYGWVAVGKLRSNAPGW